MTAMARGDAKRQRGADAGLTLEKLAEKSGEDGALALMEAVQASEDDPALYAEWDDDQIATLCANINAAAPGGLPAGFPMPPPVCVRPEPRGGQFANRQNIGDLIR
mmetsp:Transcript_65967/g.123059  ORF Transcript_65967/g.123059 Transcript_65967/m.123059 type:complete len:106 (+) Transcript_65967:76-393(+)